MTLIIASFDTPVGCLLVEYDEHYLYRSSFGTPAHTLQLSTECNALTLKITEEINYYSLNPKHLFNLPLKPQGTNYQMSVWKSLLTIPSGQTLCYGDLSNSLQSSPRAIGQACKKNPIALFIPCHRVIGKTNIGGFMGNIKENIDYKLKLLRHENSI